MTSARRDRRRVSDTAPVVYTLARVFGVAAMAIACGVLIMRTLANWEGVERRPEARDPHRMLVSAGPDQSLVHPSPALLQGSVRDRTILDWWTADGVDATENHLIKHNAKTGTTAIGPIRSWRGRIYGFVTDLVRIDGEVYGVDAARRRLFTIEPRSALVLLRGSTWPSQYADVQALAYDETADRLYAIDRRQRLLLVVDRSSGSLTPIGSGALTGYDEIRSLAWRSSDRMLYAVDNRSALLVRIDPTTSRPTRVTRLATVRNHHVEEIEFVGDHLYAVTAATGEGSDGVAQAQLHRVHLADGRMEAIGSPIDDVSPHGLLIDGVPEEVSWTRVSGPGSVVFSDPGSLNPVATFSAPGGYVLTFTVSTAAGTVSDTVTILQAPAGRER